MGPKPAAASFSPGTKSLVVPLTRKTSANRQNTIITCRSPGKPFYPIKPDQEKLSANELVLTKLFHIKHEYIFGLNSTTLTTGGGYEK